MLVPQPVYESSVVYVPMIVPVSQTVPTHVENKSPVVPVFQMQAAQQYQISYQQPLWGSGSRSGSFVVPTFQQLPTSPQALVSFDQLLQ